DPHPRVGFWALDRVDRITLPHEREALISLALQHRQASVRKAACRAEVAAGDPGLRDLLLETLFDKSPGVRRLAAFELERVFGESALPHWRGAAFRTDREHRRMAVLALCEHGEREDVEQVVRHPEPQTVAVRANVLKGLWRIDAAELDRLLLDALMD